MRSWIAISALSLLALANIACGQATQSPTTAPVATVSAAEPAPWAVSTGGISPDMEVYSSIEELSAASDLVILGTVEGVAAREVDYGTADPDERQGQGIPTVFYEVAVTETLRGKAEATVIVSAPDVDQVSMGEEATALRSGQQVLLFLREQTTEDAPGITAYDHFYVTVSLDNGVFDRLDGDLVVPRIPELFEVAEYSLDEVLVHLAVARDDDQPLATANAGQSSALWIPSPTTLQDLVNVSDAIVVGEIVGLMKQTIEGPFDDSGDTDNRDDVPPPRQYPYSYFGIRISDTLLNDGFVVDNPVLKLKGHGGDGANSQRRIRLPQAGESFVLFLSRHRYDGSYGVLGPWAMLNTDGSTVTGYGAELKEPQFAQGTTPAQLKIDVAEAVGSRVKKNPTDLLFPNIIILSTPDTPAPR